MRHRGLSENTISNRLRAIKAFSRWMSERGWTDGNALEHLHVPQTTKPDFDLIDEDVRAKLFGLYSASTFLGSRNQAMLAVLSDTGLLQEVGHGQSTRGAQVPIVGKPLTRFATGHRAIVGMPHDHHPQIAGVSRAEEIGEFFEHSLGVRLEPRVAAVE